MLTLEQAKVGMANKVDQNIIDTIQRNSRLMDLLVYDDAISPGTGGSTFVYGYTQLLTPGAAKGRKINSEYTAQEAKRTVKNTTLTIMGGSYQIDRALVRTQNGKINEVAFQNEEKAKATAARFQYLLIHGDYNTTKDTADPEFDGLDTLLSGTDNAIDGSSIDVSTVTDSSATAFDEALRYAVYSIAGGKPTFIAANSRLIAKMTTIARKLGFYDRKSDAFGNSIATYDGIELLDLGQYYNGSTTVDVIPVTNKKTNLYAARIGRDALCGVTPEGGSIGIESHLPDFKEAKAVHTGDVEMIGGIALKNTKTAFVIKDITVTA